MALVKGLAAIVTGAATGIGRATALPSAAEGAQVVVSDSESKGDLETVSLIKKVARRFSSLQTFPNTPMFPRLCRPRLTTC